MKFLLFGTGDYYNRYRIWFDRKDIAALIDNAEEKQGQYIDGIRVIPPKDISRYEYDAVVILSFYVQTMKTQLIDLGVEGNRIYHFFDLHDLIYHPGIRRKINCYGLQDCSESVKFLLLSNDLTLGGPALALYHAAQVLIKRGYQVVYGSMLDGPLRKILAGEGIPVIVDENLMIQTMDEAQWVRKYSLIICNTMNFHVFLSERDKRIPVAWWLHDALFFYDGVRQEVMDKLTQDNMAVWSVGPIPERAVKAFRPDFYVEDLIYGVTDQTEEERRSKEYLTDHTEIKIRFIIIGYIEYRKGQDILLEAIKRLEPDIRQKAEFIFVGQNTSLLAKDLIESAGEISEIMFTGPVDRSKINSLLGRADMLVCPSREDPMPTVAAEAMMHKVPCLVSDTTGTVKYIRDGIDGLIFQSENTGQLKEILERCIQGEFDLVQMGRNARNVYEEYFSMEAFENRLMELIANQI
ncbi:MAG: glycosyltransferase family 4 protein [Dorea sp.]|nr:glycosyltransferase family 4 protein [Dorea sp.]